ncbi:MAG: deoxyribonuclease IV [Peptostreptococcus porci]|uniref:Probable endonuclease 4 n=1 Tax=Peptostreptococcus porci TaxID=2652282 RepID=A0A6N7X073_9FIRM|nr:deoxyribonuclease IV [Peptostreptococcus porci]MDD7183822.1 deoxyribonuclease IV [Peptostreptococcus porci]MDY4127939.1 deoxyribonuclease IV [Peptostreptococcus porci]MDY5479236.1 deoxyribonuclease IV [Peptostreptococcus porci]MDY6231233.1 deoxyribonuclease IV [Peptostreptococcus porci]MST62360.1 deoxyribonuclease IV [Peptostreptococcus porci]
MIKIGSHLSISKGYLNMAKEATKMNANTFAFFTRNPRGGSARKLDLDDIERFNEYLKENKFEKLVAHAPYTMNLASSDEKTREFARMAMKEDIERMELIPNNYYNFHPGSHVKQGAEKGIELIAELLNEVIFEAMTTTILLETMAGKGTEVGRSFEELKQIIDKVKLKDKIGVCLDTCHVSDGGYDITNDLDFVLSEFDRIIGIDKLKALHLNDSKNPLGAHKDRHEKIGDGYLGIETFKKIVNHPYLKTLPMILETPNDFDGYKEEIEILRGLEEL